MGTYTGSDKRLQYLFQNGGGGGGTTVIANPQGQATESLSKLQVGLKIYSIPSGTGTDYTATETPIGTYLGKTLYRAVSTLTSDWALQANSWFTSNLDRGNIEHFVTAKFVDITDALHQSISVGFISNKIAVNTPRTITLYSGAEFIMEYTKTT